MINFFPNQIVLIGGVAFSCNLREPAYETGLKRYYNKKVLQKCVGKSTPCMEYTF